MHLKGSYYSAPMVKGHGGMLVHSSKSFRLNKRSKSQIDPGHKNRMLEQLLIRQPKERLRDQRLVSTTMTIPVKDRVLLSTPRLPDLGDYALSQQKQK